MAFRLLLVLLAVCSLTALAHVDDDFAEFDDEEGEFDFDMPGELTFSTKCSRVNLRIIDLITVQRRTRLLEARNRINLMTETRTGKW